MKLFTPYEDEHKKEKLFALLWDGDYKLYRELIREEPNFIGVLDDEGRKGKDNMKLWNENKKEWETCSKGNYIAKTDKGNFTVKSKEEIIYDLRRLV